MLRRCAYFNKTLKTLLQAIFYLQYDFLEYGCHIWIEYKTWAVGLNKMALNIITNITIKIIVNYNAHKKPISCGGLAVSSFLIITLLKVFCCLNTNLRAFSFRKTFGGMINFISVYFNNNIRANVSPILYKIHFLLNYS